MMVISGESSAKEPSDSSDSATKYVAPAQDGVGPHPVPHRAHHHGGVEISGPEHRRGHGGGGGLAVHAGDRHLGMIFHQLG